MIRGLDHIAITMPEGQEQVARDFFKGILSIAEVQKPHLLASRGGVWFELTDGRQLHMQSERTHIPLKRAHPAFVAQDLDSLAVALESNGRAVRWDEELAPRRRFYTEDPFGNRLEFLEPK